jgi:hypothetical protein
MRTKQLHLYRLSLALLTAVFLFLACRHNAALQELDRLRAKRQADSAYIRALEQTNECINFENNYRKTLLDIVRREGDRVILVGDGPPYNLMSRQRAESEGWITPRDRGPFQSLMPVPEK